jgi:hypothetical protein
MKHVNISQEEKEVPKSKEKCRQFTPISFYQESCQKHHRVSRKKFVKEELADFK